MTGASFQRAFRRTGARRGAFTLVELCIGMMVTGFVATVLAAFAAAMSNQWRHAEQQQHLDVVSQQGRRVMSPLVQSARAIGHIHTAPAPALFLWQNDSLDRTGIAQFGEMMLIEYDADTESIYLYQPDADYGLSTDTMAVKAVTAAEMANPAVVTLFKAQAWLKPARTLVGPGRPVDASSGLTRVIACEFERVTVNNGGATLELPLIHFNATLQRGAQSIELTDRFALRAPTANTVTATNTVTSN